MYNYCTSVYMYMHVCGCALYMYVVLDLYFSILTFPISLSLSLTFPLLSSLSLTFPLLSSLSLTFFLILLLLYLPPLSPPFLQPVRAELMQALWSTLHDPYDNVATVAYHVLGKFGGSNRKMLSTQ